MRVRQRETERVRVREREADQTREGEHQCCPVVCNVLKLNTIKKILKKPYAGGRRAGWWGHTEGQNGEVAEKGNEVGLGQKCNAVGSEQKGKAMRVGLKGRVVG